MLEPIPEKKQWSSHQTTQNTSLTHLANIRKAEVQWRFWYRTSRSCWRSKICMGWQPKVYSTFLNRGVPFKNLNLAQHHPRCQIKLKFSPTNLFLMGNILTNVTKIEFAKLTNITRNRNSPLNLTKTGVTLFFTCRMHFTEKECSPKFLV